MSGDRSQREILHADMDAFYASVEQRDRPELRGKPVIVGGTGTRGVVSAASYEARQFGVHSAMPSVQAKKLCPHGAFLPGNMSSYSRESKRIFEVFREFSPVVEGLSLDEAFIDLTGTRRLLGPARAVGERLRERVREETQLAVSVGIGPVKMVAKIASAACKPDGLLEVKPDGVRAFLDPLPVRKLWGVGPVAEQRLLRAGFYTVGDLAHVERTRIERVLGDWGLEIARLARGEDVRETEPYRDARSYSEENTFASDVSDRQLLEATILTHAESVARRLRRDEVHARTVVLKWRPGRRRKQGPRGYALFTRRTTLPEATNDGDRIAREAWKLLDKGALDEPVRLVGVGVANLEPIAETQLGLFGAPKQVQRRAKLNEALDQIADRFGGAAVKRGGQGDAERAALSMQIKRGEAED
jgi:DNA polymerase-4